ncbi:hypothetical protein DV451_004551 [Geotrichum candidum]|uniref:Amino acid permease/ SLC12A domain-containing protein n=1 Tax=Geotrichum candidum TaxID=1173061 RepID=A0A9P5KSH3_GEOCN|nr:hypothetical protein DV451_004551 [Geotrichum candidum]KAF5105417.1 hypothetical protein DV453_004839 [Geotrichum candidum]
MSEPPKHTNLGGEVDVDHMPVTTIFSNNHLHPVISDHVLTPDEEALVALGYKQEFKREFSLWSSFAVSFALLGLLPSIASTLFYGMGYAGTAGMTWGWLVAMIGIQAVANSMAELCSAMPTSGGLYYAAAVLAPPGWGPIAAWITGWSNWLCQVTSSPSIAYSMASMVLALKTLHEPEYTATTWQVYLLTVAIMVSQSVLSSLPTRMLARFNSAGTILNSVALLISLIVILAGNNREAPKFNSSAEVWGTIDNQTDWPDGIAILMSFIAIIWTMSGYDSPFHLAEECSNAAIASPRSIVMTSSIGGILGWAFQMALAYTVVDIPSVIDDELGQPFVTYLTQILNTRLVTLVTALTVISAFFMGQASMIAASRVAYAYSRDGCFPLSSYWARVNKHTDTPVNAVWLNTVIGCLLLLLMFGGGVVIDAIFSVGAISAYVAFAIPIAMKTIFAKDNFRKGPWHLGRFSTITGYISIAFVTVMTPILCFPQYRGDNLTPDLMNWTVVVYFGPMCFALIWYYAYAYKFFKGPKVNVDHLIYAQSENDTDPDTTIASTSKNGVIEGIEPVSPEDDTNGLGPKVEKRATLTRS